MIVEDDTNARKLMETVLNEYGFEPVPARDGLHALDLLDETMVDLIIVDIMMPNMDGYEFTKMLREAKWTTPILMITAKETQDEKKLGFLAGTDDYMVKPVDEEEMILRIKALLRRSDILNKHKLEVGETIFYYDELKVTHKGQEIELSNKEFLLIYKLLSYPGRIFTRRQLIDEIWSMDCESDERTVDVHVTKLRKSFKMVGDFEIKTVRGLGYKAVKND
jgi:DNA-binding response OmpR family regulator